MSNQKIEAFTFLTDLNNSNKWSYDVFNIAISVTSDDDYYLTTDYFSDLDQRHLSSIDP